MERAQAAGIELEPIIEVETVDAALSLAQRGVGDTMVARAVTRSPQFPADLHAVPFEEPLYDVMALVTRKGTELSPVMKALVSTALDLLVGSGASGR